MNVVGIIPVRIGSTRLPRKPLLSLTGKPLIQHTWETARMSRRLDRIIVATDSREIADAVTGFGGLCEMTGEHPSGSDRVAEVVRKCCTDADLIVNLQGDEPELDPRYIDAAIDSLNSHPQWSISTLVTPITSPEVLNSPHVVKAVCAQDGRALYFSRSAIPFVRDASVSEVMRSGSPWRQHVGVYVYRTDYLLKLSERPPSPLECYEKLEQLRALEDGASIGTVEIPEAIQGIDTPEDYQEFVNRRRALNSR